MTNKIGRMHYLWKIDRKLLKSSRFRVVVSGNQVEYFRYERPYYYNLPPQRKKYSFDTTFSRAENRRLDNVYRTRQTIKRIITANVTAYGCKPLFATFTFAENIDDPDQANKQWTLFTERLNDFLAKRGHDKAKYLAVVEFQKRGAVHYHVVYFNIRYIANIKTHFSDLWKNGFIKINAIENVRNVGAYVAKYLQKGLVDERLRRRRAFFTSRRLFRPVVLRDELECFAYMQNSDKMTLLDTETFSSSQYRVIDYSIYTKKNAD